MCFNLEIDAYVLLLVIFLKLKSVTQSMYRMCMNRLIAALHDIID